MPSTAPIKVPIVGVDQYSKQFKKLTKQVEQIGKGITKVGKDLTASITVPLAGIGAASFKMSKDFNAAMANVGTLIPGQTEKLKGFKTAVLDLAGDVGVSSTIISEGLYETISAFGDAQDPINKLTVATTMSKAGMSSVKEALSLVSAVTKGYGDTSDAAAQKASDLAFMTVKLGQTTFPELASSIGKVVPLATTLNVKQEELFGSFATLTGVTGSASEVTTQLAAAFGAFIKPSEAMTKAAKKSGFESATAMVKQLGLRDSLAAIGKVAGGSEQKLGKMLTTKEGLVAALTLLGPQAENFEKKITDMGGAAGATDEAFIAQTQGINKAGFAFDQMTERLRRLSIQIGDKLAPVAKRLMDRLEPLFETFENMSPATLDLGIKIAGIAAAIGPLILVVGKLVTVGSTVMGIIGGAGGMAGVLAAITGPVGIAVAAVAGLTAAIIYFRKELAPIGTAIIEPLKAVLSDFNNVLFKSDSNLSRTGDALKALIAPLASLVAPIVKLGVKLVLLPLRMIIRWVRIGADTLGVLSAAITVVIKAARYAYTWMSKLWESFTEGTTVGKALKSVFDFVGDAVSTVWDKVKGLWSTIGEFFSGVKDFLGGIADKIDVATKKQEGIKEAMGAGAEAAPLPAEVMPDVIRNIEAGKTESSFNIVFEGLPDGATAKVTKAKGGRARVKAKGKSMEGAL